MRRFIYTDTETGVVAVVTPAPKESIERDLNRSLTIEEYEMFVWDKSVPEDAINPRFIDDTDFPENREFRGAWCDMTEESRIDIDLLKAKEIMLENLRRTRDQALEDTDTAFIEALSKGEDAKLTEIAQTKEALRNITEPLKALEVSGYNDEEVLNQIRLLGKFS